MKTKAALSAFSGFFFALMGYPVLLFLKVEHPLFLAAVSGLLFALLLFPALLICGKHMEKRYAAFENKITSPVFFKANGNFTLDNGKVKNGNLYFCDAGILCLCLEEKPYTLDEIPLDDITRFRFDHIHMHVFVKDGRILAVTTPDAPAIAEALEKKGWLLPGITGIEE